MLTVAYIRVSTEDQIEHSPEAQTNRCRQYAELHDLGAVTVLSDEGWSGKNLDRPSMQRLLPLLEAGQVSDLIVWRLDRLTRDSGDQSALVKLCERMCVTVHSVTEGVIDVTTAAGRMQVGVHGVFAQFYREHIVENVRMGMDQAARKGRWLNRAPTGFDMIDGELVANDMAPIVQRIFALRTEGDSYPTIEAKVGVKYSTVRQILGNKVYLGQVRLRDQWFPGIHTPLVTQAEFDAAQRGHVPGRRRGRDLLSGRVRCGLCRRLVTVDYNERGQAIYRCKHRGQGCDQPGRSAKGLHKAAALSLHLVGESEELQDAIRQDLGQHIDAGSQATKASSRDRSLGSLRQKRTKLLDLYYADRITPEAFQEEEQRLTNLIDAIDAEANRVEVERTERDELAERFEEVATILRTLDIETIWQEATDAEKRVLIEELLDCVVIFPDHLEVEVSGAPPLNVTLAEVGLRPFRSTRSVVSEGGLVP